MRFRPGAAAAEVEHALGLRVAVALLPEDLTAVMRRVREARAAFQQKQALLAPRQGTGGGGTGGGAAALSAFQQKQAVPVQRQASASGAAAPPVGSSGKKRKRKGGKGAMNS